MCVMFVCVYVVFTCVFCLFMVLQLWSYANWHILDIVFLKAQKRLRKTCFDIAHACHLYLVSRAFCQFSISFNLFTCILFGVPLPVIWITHMEGRLKRNVGQLARKEDQAYSLYFTGVIKDRIDSPLRVWKEVPVSTLHWDHGNDKALRWQYRKNMQPHSTLCTRYLVPRWRHVTTRYTYSHQVQAFSYPFTVQI